MRAISGSWQLPRPQRWERGIPSGGRGRCVCSEDVSWPRTSGWRRDRRQPWHGAGVRPGQAQAGPALPHPRPQEPRPPPQWPSARTAEGSTISSGASSRRGECRLRAAVTPRLAGRTPDGGRGLRWAGWPRCPDLSQAAQRTRHSRDRLCLVSATMCPTFLNGSGVPSGGPDIGGAKVNGSRSVPESLRQGWAPGWTYSLI